jgi:hypothetical protein
VGLRRTVADPGLTYETMGGQRREQATNGDQREPGRRDRRKEEKKTCVVESYVKIAAPNCW